MKGDAEKFDVIFRSSILHHVNIDVVLPAIYRMLRKQGKMIFTEPNMMNPQIAIVKNCSYLKKKMGDSPDETAFLKWKLKKKLMRFGFKNIEITPFDFLHPLTPKQLITFVDRAGKVLEAAPFINNIAGSLLILACKT